MGGLGIQTPAGVEGIYVVDQKNLIEKMMSILAYLFIPLLITRKWKLCIYLLTKDIPLIFLLLLANFSIIWSDANLDNNLSSLRGLLLSTMLGVYLAARFSIKDQARLLAGVFGIVILSSIFAALFLPGYGIHAGSRLSGWTGIFPHKNLLGGHMAWSAAVFLSLSLGISQNSLVRLALWTGFALSSMLVFLAGSAGGIINSVCVISIVPLSRFLRKAYYKIQVILIVSTTLIIISSSILVVANSETIAQSLGKDLTFSGRIPLWSTLMDYVAQKPLFGYGFNGFWNSEYGQMFRLRWVWETVPQSHNGFVELLLALGLIGFLLFAMSFVVQLLRAYKHLYEAKTLEDVLPMQFLITFLLANFSESRLLIANNIYWVIYVAMSLSLAIEHRQAHKLRAIK